MVWALGCEKAFGFLIMVLRHVGSTFQHRLAEWLLAAILLTWGVVLIRPEYSFDTSAAFMGLAAIAPERTWGWFCILTGLSRLFALVVNGVWTPPTYWLRSLTSGLSILFWFTVVFGIVVNGLPSTGLAVYPWLLVAELFCLYRTARDYRISIIQKGI